MTKNMKGWVVAKSSEGVQARTGKSVTKQTPTGSVTLRKEQHNGLKQEQETD